MVEKKTRAKIGQRVDAQRNRSRLLEAAKECFAKGGDAVTLDDIVNHAGVGIGTLYRHFKTREALIEAVYLTEHEKLVERAKELESSMSAVDALEQWLLSFVDMLATKRAMRESLNLLFSTKPEVHATSRNMMQPNLRRMIERASAAGEVSTSIDPVDILRALVGIAYGSNEPDWQENAHNFVRLLIMGMRVKR
ncbi:MAG TPA: helix-turn-helix domain-containing protein [Oculatellaceae cyanobacterium]